MESIETFTDEQLFHDLSNDGVTTSAQVIESAKSGDGSALYQIGKSYYNIESYIKAIAWFERSAFKNNSDAQFRLGYIFDVGEGVSEDYKLAMKWYKLATKNGDSTAMNNVGCLYDNGNGVPVNYKLAMDWYLKSAELNNPNAQWNIGVLYEYGLGVTRDKKQALEWYYRGAYQGFEAAKERVEILKSQGIYLDSKQRVLLSIDKRTWELRKDFQDKIDCLEIKNKQVKSELISMQNLNQDLQDQLVLLEHEKRKELCQFTKKMEKMEQRINIMERELKIQKLETQVRLLKINNLEKERTDPSRKKANMPSFKNNKQ